MPICKIRLLVTQFPDGPTRHVVSVGTDPRALSDVYTVAKSTEEGDWIALSGDGDAPDAEANELDNVRYLQVTTVESPSWIAWREIEVYAPAFGAQ
jgi:hypothetical protein